MSWLETRWSAARSRTAHHLAYVLACVLMLLPGMAMAQLTVGIKAVPPIHTTSIAANSLGVYTGTSHPSVPQYGSVHYQVTLSTGVVVPAGASVTVDIPAGITLNSGPDVYSYFANLARCTPNATLIGPATLTCTTGNQTIPANTTIPLADLYGIKTSTSSITATTTVASGDLSCAVATPPARCTASITVTDSTPPGGMAGRCPSTPYVSSGSFSANPIPVGTDAGGWYSNAVTPQFAPNATPIYNYIGNAGTHHNSDVTAGLFSIANPSDTNPSTGIYSAMQETDGSNTAVVYDIPNQLLAGVTYQFTTDMTNRFGQAIFRDYYKISLYNQTTGLVTTLFNGPTDTIPYALSANAGWATLSDTFTVPTTGNYRILFQIDPNVDNTIQNADYMFDRVAICGMFVISADLVLTKTNTPGFNGELDQATDTVVSGTTTTYTITVTNNGPGAADNSVLKDPASPSLDCSTPASDAICTSANGASCPTQTGAALITALQGTGAVIQNLPNGGSIKVLLTCTVR